MALTLALSSREKRKEVHIMKKVLSIFLAVLLLLSISAMLFGCDGNGTNGETNRPPAGNGNQPPPEPPEPTVPETPVQYFEFRAIAGGIEITNYTGTAIRVNIPAQIEGVNVVSIGEDAFRDAGIMEVFMPATVTSIGNSAFRVNPGLTEIHLHEGITEIGAVAFMGTALTSVVIPNSVTTIGASAFSDTPLTSVTIGNGVTTIDQRAFYGTQLTNVIIPESVTTIGWSVFANTALTSVVIPDSVTEIGSNAFENSQLTSVTIGNGVTTIGWDAFANTALTSVIIPDSVTEIGWGAFRNDNAHTAITVGNQTYTIQAGQSWPDQLWGWRRPE